MKHFTKLLILFSAILLLTGMNTGFSQTTQFEENFDYPAEDLITAHGWFAHSTGANPITVNNGGLSFTGYYASGIGNAALVDNTGEDDSKTFSAQSSGTVYTAFMVNVVGISAGYFFHLGGDPIGTTFRGKVFMNANGQFGVSVGSNTGTFATSSFVTGTTYLLVLKYEIVDGTSNNKVSLFIIDGTIPTTEPAPTIGPLTDGTMSDISPASVALRQYSSSQNILVDGIRVAKTWSEVLFNTIAAPSTQATNVSFSNITSIGFTASWTRGNGDNCAVFVKQANTGTAAPADNTTYTADPAFGSGTEITGTGWYCVYNGTGTTVNISNLSASTDYIVHVCEYNGAAGGEKYNSASATGNPASQTTPAAVSPVLLATSMTGFGNVCINTTAGPNTFTITGENLTTDNVTVDSLGGFSFSTTESGTYEKYLSLAQTGGTYSQVIYVKFSPDSVKSYNGNIVVGGGGAPSVNVAATGSGVNTLSTVYTLSPPANITEFSADCSGRLPHDTLQNGCTPVFRHGICWGTSFNPDTTNHTVIPNGDTGIYVSTVTGLLPYTQYHYRAWALSASGLSYGFDYTFTTLNLTPPVATAATNVSFDSFTANWEPVSGAEGYYLDVYTTSAGNWATDLIISEYVEGNGFNKYIEIYNGTASTIDLANYKFMLYPNGGTTPNPTELLNGTIASGETKVYQNSGASLTLPPGVTATNSTAVNYNGDDAFVLAKGTPTVYVDIFGNIGEDPGVAWTSASNSTLDHTLRRNSSVGTGVSTDPVTGFPTLEGEWTQYPIDDVSGLGSHTYSGATNTFILQNFDVGNVTSFNVTGLTPNTEYHYVVRAYYQTSTSASSNVIDVTTTPAPILSVTTEVPTAVTSSTATGHGTITGVGAAPATARGFCWDLAANADPDVNDFKVEETGSFGLGAFTGSITGLLGNTAYKIRAYVIDATDTAYGEVRTITTLKAEPTNHATLFQVDSTTTSAVYLSWTDAIGDVIPDGYLIKGSAVSFEAIIDPVDGTPENNGALVQNVLPGVEAHAFTSLSQGTVYYFKLWGYTNSGTVIDYKLGTVGDPVPSAYDTTQTPPPGAILYEPFSYPAGEFIGGNTTGTGGTSNNWTTHSNGTTTTGTIDLIEGSLTYSAMDTSTGNKILMPGSNATTPRDVNRAIPANTNTVMYISFLLNVIDNTQLVTAFTTDNYFMHFANTAGVSAGTFYGRIFIKSVNTGANFRLGIQNTTGGTPTQTEIPTDLSFGTTYLVVMKYDFNGGSPDIATLWVNPSPLGGDEPAGGVTNSSGTATTSTSFAAICLRNAASTPKAHIDEIRIGSTWADVTPPSTTLKTLNLRLFLEGLYAGAGTMNQAMDENGAHFDPNVADQIIVELHEAGNYASDVYTSAATDLSTTGEATIAGIPSEFSADYYITILHRNSIVTVSALPVPFAGQTVNYDFTTGATQAYSDNQKDLGDGNYAIWGGDVNQDGIVDSGDMNPVDNASTAIMMGYVPEDVNGDGLVDSGDMNIVDNNSTAVIIGWTP